MAKETKKIMVTGSVGQIGSELTMLLREKYGNDNVLATGHKTQPTPELRDSGPFEFINVAKKETIEEVVKKYKIDTIYHMSAILSAVGEKNPHLCWDVNMNGTKNIMDIALEYEMGKIFIPSSIAVFGPETPIDNTPQETVLRPKTMYGVTKVAGEILCDYYVKRFGLDVRGCRYPGIISNETLPGGGTTDYAVAIYYEAVKNKRYTCFVREDTRLPMMYMPDCLKATIDLMEADFDTLIHHSDFNVTAMSFSAGELADSIKQHIPEFECTFEPDFRQEIADSWPNSIDDTAAREEWGWKPEYDLEAMTEDMLNVLSKRHAEGNLGY
ncbi:MAG: NAD-dependent epimerase/dehydratase family protein [Candidatus Aminicenantes bacterium]|jgi:nucleoside-diphosphate-sugar epimerase